MLDTQAAQAAALVQAGVPDHVVWLWMVGAIVFLALMLVVIISICLSQRASYQRQLKAATITAFGKKVVCLCETSVQRVSIQFDHIKVIFNVFEC